MFRASLLVAALASSIDAFEFNITKILEFTVQKSKYTPEELREFTILQRLQARDWTIELFGLGTILVYFFLWAGGAYINRSKVSSWLKNHEEVLKDQFYQVGVTPDQLYIEDNAESYSSYATGRLNIARFNIRFTLQPRHNLFLYFMEVVLSFFFTSIVKPEDRIDIAVTLDKNASERLEQYIWAVVNKDNMNKYRELNYYLSLTKTTDSSKLPLQFVFMSEVPELSETLYSAELNKAISTSGKTLRYLAVTDQPQEKPQTVLETKPNKRLILQLNFPSSGDVAGSKELLNAFIQFVDSAVKKDIKPETVKKVLKVRDNEIKKIQKIHEEAKREEEEYQRAEKRKNLSEEQLKKLEKKKQKKQMKQQRVR